MLEDMPIGLTMAFSEDLEAFRFFSSLTPSQQYQIIERAQGMHARQEFTGLVQSLRDPPMF